MGGSDGPVEGVRRLDLVRRPVQIIFRMRRALPALFLSGVISSVAAAGECPKLPQTTVTASAPNDQSKVAGTLPSNTELKPGDQENLKALKGRVSCKMKDGAALLALNLSTDGVPDFVKDAVKNKKQLPSALPSFKIVDESGNVLGNGKFEFG